MGGRACSGGWVGGWAGERSRVDGWEGCKEPDDDKVSANWLSLIDPFQTVLSACLRRVKARSHCTCFMVLKQDETGQ